MVLRGRRCLGGWAATAAALLAAAACHVQPYRFRLAPPMTRLPDERPIPVPPPTEIWKGRADFRSTVKNPKTSLRGKVEIPRAGDVNAMDETVASAWFTPRIGAVTLSPEELARGPQNADPPQPPLTVLESVKEPTPGLLARDQRGLRYHLAFDPADELGRRTATAQLVTRLFWAFGYNVAGVHLALLGRDELQIDPAARAAEVEAVLAAAARQGDRYRASCTLLPEGIPLGPFSPRGVRVADANDLIAHQNRRALRALLVVGAWVSFTEIRPAHTLDVYEGKPGEGFVRHYFVALDDALGSHGNEPDRPWDGYNHFFTSSEILRNFTSLGLPLRPWEELQPTPWKSVGPFQADLFRFPNWRETRSYAPLRRSLPADDYWAVKVLAAFTPEQVAAVVQAGQYPEDGAADYVTKTLLERRRKITDAVIAEVAALEPVSVTPGELRLEDRGRALIPDAGGPVRYEVRLHDGRNKKLESLTVDGGETPQFTIRSDRLGGNLAGGYVRVDVQVVRGGKKAGSPAEFHIRPGPDGAPRLVGVVR